MKNLIEIEINEKIIKVDNKITITGILLIIIGIISFNIIKENKKSSHEFYNKLIDSLDKKYHHVYDKTCSLSGEYYYSNQINGDYFFRREEQLSNLEYEFENSEFNQIGNEIEIKRTFLKIIYDTFEDFPIKTRITYWHQDSFGNRYYSSYALITEAYIKIDSELEYRIVVQNNDGFFINETKLFKNDELLVTNSH